MRSALVLLALAVPALSALADVGAPGWTCPAEVMKKSKTVPKSAHSVRYADIEYIGALGDSLTAANGAGAPKGDPIAVAIQYRGLNFNTGGDKTLDEHVTLANVLKKFNPNLFGYSVGTGSADVWEKSHLNAGIPGAHAYDLLDQAKDLVRRINEHPLEVDYQNKWKLIHIFIGGNDMCKYCKKPDIEAPNAFRDNIKDSIQYLKDNLPKTIVVLTGMLDLSILRKVDKDQYFCDALHLFECACESDDSFTDQQIRDACQLYMAREQEMQDSGMFDDKDDFTLVIQPLFEELNNPPTNPDGTPNLDFFAPDCFHFSQLGHAMVAKNLWNNIVAPVGQKKRTADLNDQTFPLSCPDASCPFLRTTKNSKDCSKYMTPSA